MDDRTDHQLRVDGAPSDLGRVTLREDADGLSVDDNGVPSHVDLAWIGRDFGLPAAKVRAAFRAYDDATRILDAPLSAVMNGGTILMRQYEEARVLAYQALRGRARP